MKRRYLAVLVAAIALGGSSLAAQQPSPAAKKGTPQHDSLKTVKKTIKSDKAARKLAKAKGDTATARALKKQIKAEEKTKAALKSETATPAGKKPATPPKP
jgi:predicted secreted protein